MTVLAQRVASANYVKQRDDIISMNAGDIIEQLGQPTSGWCKGRNVRTGEQGWFPFDMTKEVSVQTAQQNQTQEEEDDEYYYEEEEEPEATKQQAPAPHPSSKQQQAPQNTGNQVKQTAGIYSGQQQQSQSQQNTTASVINFQLTQDESIQILQQQINTFQQQIQKLQQDNLNKDAQIKNLQEENTKLHTKLENLEKKTLDKTELSQKYEEKYLEQETRFKLVEEKYNIQACIEEATIKMSETLQRINQLEMENIKLTNQQLFGKQRPQGELKVQQHRIPLNRQTISLDASQIKALYH